MLHPICPVLMLKIPSLVLQVRDFLGEQMSLRGINIHSEETPQAIVKSSDGLLSVKTNQGTVDGFTHVMFATGRKPNTKVNISYVVRLHDHQFFNVLVNSSFIVHMLVFNTEPLL